ncbi:FMN-binding negative transcriptional regulator [Aliiglaciecola sp. LCG003]|uniref:FMN-binding negative transcriptional regulator n=1 Tax=Aliiglaciecola sp. LCG003 TaxID=3053655 RepID=UPI002572BCC7|nr:FMN-binding negative transcriptional regulator [Aliiglaciecola sp. LCG003]WJG09187.1 FMN-binding negative transcriptional regulator [Aliiglaciecola sp. LCG003]
MYIPKNMQLNDDEVIVRFIRQYSFGQLITSTLDVTYLPLVLESDEAEKGVLYGHMARANSQWKNLQDQRVLVVFNGPHSYISPTWYQTTPAVPTWNYAAVHCYGKVELLDDTQSSIALDKLVAQFEPALLQNTEVMPKSYQRKLDQAIVGFKIVIDDIQAKEKLGQHRSAADQNSVFTALQTSPHADARQLASYMQLRNLGTGSE